MDAVETGAYILFEFGKESMLNATLRQLVNISTSMWLVIPLTNQLLMGSRRSSMEMTWWHPTKNPST